MDVSNALVTAINAHQDKIASGLMGIGGTVVGWSLGFLGEQWRGRGSLRFEPLAIIKRGAPDWAEAQQLACDFHFRVLNSFPTEKSIGIKSVEFFQKRPRRRTPATSTDPAPTIGYERHCPCNQDLHLPPRTFTRIHLSVASKWTCQPTYTPEMTKLVRSLRLVRVRLIVSPRKIQTLLYDLDKALDREDPLNEEFLHVNSY